MPAVVWLVAAIAAAGAAYLVGWPAWSGSREREAHDLNAERYQAWRGRAIRGPRASMREGMTDDERRRVIVGAALGLVAVACLVAFFVAS